MVLKELPFPATHDTVGYPLKNGRGGWLKRYRNSIGVFVLLFEHLFLTPTMQLRNGRLLSNAPGQPRQLKSEHDNDRSLAMQIKLEATEKPSFSFRRGKVAVGLMLMLHSLIRRNRF